MIEQSSTSFKTNIFMPEPALQNLAWIGDAVLSLYSREWILARKSKVDGEMESRMTCNQFLCCFAQPTEFEARIGRIYQTEGLPAAFAFIEATIIPLFQKQEKKRSKT